MLDTPQITETAAQLTAVIHLTIPREEIRNVMGPGIGELMAAIASHGITPAGPWFTHHLKIDPDTFDFEIGVPVTAPVAAAGRMKPGQLPATMVARTVYLGPTRASVPPGASSMPGSRPRGTRRERTSGNATSWARSRTPTRSPGARSSTDH